MSAAHRLRYGLLLLALIPVISGCPNNQDPGLQFKSCDELVANERVQAALTALVGGGQGFTFTSGLVPFNPNGTWEIASGTTTFTQNGLANLPVPPGRMSFVRTGTGTVDWTSEQTTTAATSRMGFVQGVDTSFTLCMFADVQTGASVGMFTCETQNAVFFTLTPSMDGERLTGTFLNVVLAVRSGTCQQVGNFSFGNIVLDKLDTTTPVIEALGSFQLGFGAPTSVALNADGSAGFVTSSAGTLTRFVTSTRAATTVTLPTPNNITGFSPLGLRSGNAGVVTTGDNRVLSFGTGNPPPLEAHVIPPTQPSVGTFLPLAPLYNTLGSTGYVGVSFQVNRPGFASFNALTGGNQVGINGLVSFTQDELRHIMIAPNDSQLVGMLGGSAPAGRARFVGFVSLTSNSLVGEVDVSSALLGDFRADEAVFRTDSAELFLTNDRDLITLQTSGSFSLSTVDPRDDGADRIRRLAVSSDGDAMAVSIAAAPGRSHLVILDPDDRSEIHAFQDDALRVDASRSQLAFFPGTRIAVIENGAGQIIPVNTDEPFIIGAPLTARTGGSGNIVSMAVAGRVLAVANETDRTIYLFRLSVP